MSSKKPPSKLRLETIRNDGSVSLEKALSLYEEKLDNEPIRKAFTIERAENAWAMATIHYQGDNIVKIDRTVPDLKAQAINTFKIAAFRYWSDYDKPQQAV